ncbi:MAG: hypothetical protein U0470_06920 [Anaerolineae bacterium]
MDDGVPYVVLFVIVAIGLRIVAGTMDGDRVRMYIERRGGRLLSSFWTPFGKGWFGERSDRIYVVRYLDESGDEHEAHCKTSLFTGVYFTEDHIVRSGEHRLDEPNDASRVAELERENRRLRAELDRARDNAG